MTNLYFTTRQNNQFHKCTTRKLRILKSKIYVNIWSCFIHRVADLKWTASTGSTDLEKSQFFKWTMDLFSPDTSSENAKGKNPRCQKWWFTHFTLAIIYLALTLPEKKNAFRFGLMPLILIAYKIILKNQCVKVCRWLSEKWRSHYHLQLLLHSKF